MPRIVVTQIIDDLKWGGAQALIALFAEHARHNRIDLDVVALGGAGDAPWAARIAAQGATVRHLPARKVLDPARFGQVLRHLRRRRPAVAHCHLRAANTLGPPAARLAGAAALGGLHLMPQEGGDWRARLRRAGEIAALRRCAVGAIACADGVAAAWRPLLSPLPVGVAVNPAPEPRPSPIDRAALAGLLGAAPGELLFAVVGRLAPEKGLDVLLRALAALGPAPFRLAIVGSGPARAALEAAARAAGLAARVVFLGARPDAAAIAAAADVYVSAARSEGLSMAMMEAVAAGRPVVATDVGDARAALDPSASLLVAPDDAAALSAALGAVLRDAARLRAMTAAAARSAAAMRAPAAWAAELAEIYRAAAQRHGCFAHPRKDRLHA